MSLLGCNSPVRVKETKQYRTSSQAEKNEQEELGR